MSSISTRVVLTLARGVILGEYGQFGPYYSVSLPGVDPTVWSHAEEYPTPSSVL